MFILVQSPSRHRFEGEYPRFTTLFVDAAKDKRQLSANERALRKEVKDLQKKLDAATRAAAKGLDSDGPESEDPSGDEAAHASLQASVSTVLV